MIQNPFSFAPELLPNSFDSLKEQQRIRQAPNRHLGVRVCVRVCVCVCGLLYKLKETRLQHRLSH